VESKNTDLKKLPSLLAVTLLVATVASVARAQDPSFLGIQSYGVIEYLSIPKITISGTDFIVNGEPYVFRGVNVQFVGLHEPEYWTTHLEINSGSFELLKSWNVNLLRVWLCMSMATPAKGVWSQNFFDRLEALLDLAEEYEIYLLITMSQWRLSDRWGSENSGLPIWMVQDYSRESEAWEALYTDATLQGYIGECWQRIAEICKDRNIVMGYDVFNEPAIRGIRATHFLEDISSYITAVDPDKPQCVENNFINYYVKPNIPNLFCAPHGYMGHTYVSRNSVEDMKEWFRGSYWVQGSYWNVPTMNNEWFLGTRSEAQEWGLTSSDIATWYDTYITAMEELGISWAVLRCEADIFNHHWAGRSVRNVLYSYWDLNTFPT